MPGSPENSGADGRSDDRACDALQIKKSATGFASGTLALSLGTTGAQALVILSSPVLSRLFLPEAFGLAAIFGAITGTVSLVGCLSYELAIVLPKRDEDAANLAGLCLILNVGVAAVVAMLVWSCGTPLLSVLKADELEPYKWLIPVVVLLLGLALPFRYWSSRHSRFKEIGWATLASALVNTVSTVGAGLLGFASGPNLIVARLPAVATVPGLLGWHCLRKDLRFFMRHCTVRGMWAMATRYSKFPLVATWSALLDAASRQLPVVVMISFFGPEVTGLYALGQRVLAMPGQLISHSIAQVFFQRAAAEHATGAELGNLVRDIYTRLITVGLLPMLIVAMVGPDLFRFVFGEHWADAGTYSSILTMWMLVMFVSSPLSTIYTVLERQGLRLFMNVLLFAGRLGTLLIGAALFKSVVPTLVLFSGAGCVSCLISLYIVTRLTRADSGAILKHLALHLAYFVPSAVIMGVVKWGLNLGSAYVTLAAALAVAPYMALALRRDEQLRAAFVKAVKSVLRLGR